MPTYCIRYKPGPAWQSDRPTSQQAGIPEHGRYLDGLLDTGVLLLAGPLGEADGGLVIVRTATAAHAEALAANDPAVKAGVMRACVARWTILFDAARGLSPLRQNRAGSPLPDP